MLKRGLMEAIKKLQLFFWFCLDSCFFFSCSLILGWILMKKCLNNRTKHENLDIAFFSSKIGLTMLYIALLDKQWKTRWCIFIHWVFHCSYFIIHIFILQQWRLCEVGIQSERVHTYLSFVAGTLFVKWCNGQRTHTGEPTGLLEWPADLPLHLSGQRVSILWNHFVDVILWLHWIC